MTDTYAITVKYDAVSKLYRVEVLHVGWGMIFSRIAKTDEQLKGILQLATELVAQRVQPVKEL